MNNRLLLLETMKRKKKGIKPPETDINSWNWLPEDARHMRRPVEDYVFKKLEGEYRVQTHGTRNS